MIECKNIAVAYGKKAILDKISFTANSGEITVILGKNGCGKTTLLRAVSGYSKYSGSIKADNFEISTLSISERSKLISVMPQMLKKASITIRELVSFGRQPYTGITGILSAKDRKIVDDVIEKTGLSELADKKLSCISGGERQKAYFALLLSQNTQNLLLDEPGSHLDAAYTNNLMQFLTEEKNNCKTILAVFHDINRTIDIADKIIVIHESNIIFDGNRDDFCNSNIAEKIFGLKKYVCSEQSDLATNKIYFL